MLVPPSPFKDRKSLVGRAPALSMSVKSLTEQQARQQILEIVKRLKVSLESFSFDKNEYHYDTLRRLSKELITDIWTDPKRPGSFDVCIKETDKYLYWLSQELGIMKRDWSKLTPEQKKQSYKNVSSGDFYEMGESIRTASQKIARIAMQYKLTADSPDWRPGHMTGEDFYTRSLGSFESKSSSMSGKGEEGRFYNDLVKKLLSFIKEMEHVHYICEEMTELLEDGVGSVAKKLSKAVDKMSLRTYDAIDHMRRIIRGVTQKRAGYYLENYHWTDTIDSLKVVIKLIPTINMDDFRYFFVSTAGSNREYHSGRFIDAMNTLHRTPAMINHLSGMYQDWKKIQSKYDPHKLTRLISDIFKQDVTAQNLTELPRIQIGQGGRLVRLYAANANDQAYMRNAMDNFISDNFLDIDWEVVRKSLPERTNWPFGPSRFQMKRMQAGYKCQTGVNKGKPGRCPGPQKNPSQEASQKPSTSSESKKRRNPPASRETLVEARRIGDDPRTAEIILSNGEPAPSHIKAAMVPPKWTDVKISTDPNSDVLVTGRDAKGRSKTIYSQNHHMRKAAAKFSKIREMLKYRDVMKKQIQEGVNNPKTKEAATCLWLIEQQGTRPGSEKDTKADKQAYGATTLQARHIFPSREGGGALIAFVGKEGIIQKHIIQDPELAKELLRRKQEAKNPKDKIFNTSDKELRDYTKTLGKGGFTPKDFRTLKGTSLAIQLINGAESPPTNEKEYKKRVKGVATVVSKVLGNTPAMALSAYIDPTVWSSWRVTEDA